MADTNLCDDGPRLVIVESPYAGDVARNEAYARAAMLDCLSRGEAPFASHLLYTQILDDEDATDRAAGIAAGLAWMIRSDATVVYADLGLSEGMVHGIRAAMRRPRPVVEFRFLRGEWSAARPQPVAVTGARDAIEQARVVWSTQTDNDPINAIARALLERQADMLDAEYPSEADRIRAEISEIYEG